MLSSSPFILVSEDLLDILMVIRGPELFRKP